jgi:hypothetical protein
VTGAEVAAPCRHVGSPPAVVVERVAEAIKSLAAHPDVLARHGISASEFASAFPAAIESVRGSMSASNAGRREYLTGVLGHLVDRGLVTNVSAPVYGDDTVYRLSVPSIGTVAIIQKGCPDGAHSSVSWTAPDWADETYLWWLCPSMKAHPGEHIAKGVNRLRRRFFSEAPDILSGVIFQNELCGSSVRPCPKQDRSALIGIQRVPAPCIYTMPERADEANTWNWTGDRDLKFPAVLLAAFGIPTADAASFVGFVGFQRRDNGTLRTTITTRSGAGRSSTFRN